MRIVSSRQGTLASPDLVKSSRETPSMTWPQKSGLLMIVSSSPCFSKRCLPFTVSFFFRHWFCARNGRKFSQEYYSLTVEHSLTSADRFCSQGWSELPPFHICRLISTQHWTELPPLYICLLILDSHWLVTGMQWEYCACLRMVRYSHVNCNGVGAWGEWPPSTVLGM